MGRTLEGRLLKMLDGVTELTLELLNKSNPGVGGGSEYNRTVHQRDRLSARFRQTVLSRPPGCPAPESEQRVASARISAGKRPEVSVGATARFRWTECVLKSRHDTATSANLTVRYAWLGPSAGSISVDEGSGGLYWLRFTLSTKPPMPTVAVPRSSPPVRLGWELADVRRAADARIAADHGRVAPLLKQISAGVALGHRHATGLSAQDDPQKTPEIDHERR